MSIIITDILKKEETKDIKYLNEKILRFRFSKTRSISTYHRAILDDKGVESILPNAPNRQGIEQNFKNLQFKIEEAFLNYKDSRAFKLRNIFEPVDFLKLNIEHCCSPFYIYTNGQVIISLVVIWEKLIEVITHRESRDFLAFCSDLEPLHIADPKTINLFGSFQSAETWILRCLLRLEVQAIPMMKKSLMGGGKEQCVLLQPISTRRNAWLMNAMGKTTRIVLGDEEIYRFLNELNIKGYRTKTCATCRHFHFSGMSRDMSSGFTGYCGPRLEVVEGSSKPKQGMDIYPSLQPIVSVFDVCEEYNFIEDKDRSIPYK